jgi:hypothetical protein
MGATSIARVSPGMVASTWWLTPSRNRFAPQTLDQLDALGSVWHAHRRRRKYHRSARVALSISPIGETHPNVAAADGVSLFTGSLIRNETPFGAHRVIYTRLGVSGNQWPVAVANSNVSGGDTPLSVQFNSTGSTDPDGTLAAYDWDFGDGNTSTQADPSPYTTLHW